MQRPAIFRFLFAVPVLAGCFVASQEKKAEPAPPPAPMISPDVHADRSVTFRLQAPNAKEVKLDREGAEPVEMQKDAQGVWTVATAPLAPDYYGYSFSIDGVRSLDASNSSLVPNLIFPGNDVHVP